MMTETQHIDLLEKTFASEMPLTNHMGIQVLSYHDDQLCVSARLKDNLNHKDTAFGGSLATLTILSGWGLLFLKFIELDINAKVIIQKSTTSYLNCVNHDFTAQCHIENKDAFNYFLTTLQKKSRARITLNSQIYDNNQLAVTFEGVYVAMRT